MLRWKWFLLFILFVFTSCGERQEVKLRFTPAENARIDTLFTSQVDSLRPLWDSLCEANFETNLQLAVDSIIEQRQLEEARLRERFEGE